MPFLIGAVLATIVCIFARSSGFDRDRAFYSTVLIVVATYYALFAVVGDSMQVLAVEVLAAVPFFVLAVVGFKKNMWLVAAGLTAHGVFDFFHSMFIQNPGLPAFWPGFCMGYDVLAGVLMAFLLKRPGHLLP